MLKSHLWSRQIENFPMILNFSDLINNIKIDLKVLKNNNEVYINGNRFEILESNKNSNKLNIIPYQLHIESLIKNRDLSLPFETYKDRIESFILQSGGKDDVLLSRYLSICINYTEHEGTNLANIYGELLLPNIQFKVTEIQPLRLKQELTISKQLLDKNDQNFTSGYITLDKISTIIPYI